jgi:hypothetical protein
MIPPLFGKLHQRQGLQTLMKLVGEAKYPSISDRNYITSFVMPSEGIK